MTLNHFFLWSTLHKHSSIGFVCSTYRSRFLRSCFGADVMASSELSVRSAYLESRWTFYCYKLKVVQSNQGTIRTFLMLLTSFIDSPLFEWTEILFQGMILLLSFSCARSDLPLYNREIFKCQKKLLFGCSSCRLGVFLRYWFLILARPFLLLW